MRKQEDAGACGRCNYDGRETEAGGQQEPTSPGAAGNQPRRPRIATRRIGSGARARSRLPPDRWRIAPSGVARAADTPENRIRRSARQTVGFRCEPFNPKRVVASRKSSDRRIGQGWIASRSACVGKDATQPATGLVHRGAGLIDDADPEHETVIYAVVTREVRRDTGCPQLLGV